MFKWLTLFIFSLGTYGYGFQVEFPNDTFDVVGSGKTRSVIIENVNQDVIALDISVAPRSIDIDGNETLGLSSPDFDIYPAQLLINPGEDAIVTIVWKGDVPKSERAFRVVSRQIPFNDASMYKNGPIEIEMARRFLHAAYVAPPGVTPNIVLASITPSQNAIKKELVLTIQNIGFAHKILSRGRLRITHYSDENGRSIALNSPLDIPLFKDNKRINLLAGGSYRFIADWPENLPSTNVLKGVLREFQ
jgi:fimbrial chaperone protein